MKILLVNYWVGKTFSGGIAAMSALMKRLGHEVELFMPGADTAREAFEANLKAYDPEVMALSTYSFQWKYHKQFIQWARDAKKDLFILVGGYHPTFAPEEVINTPGVDVICRGEGERPVTELLDALVSDRDYRSISNLFVKERSGGGEEKIHRNPYRNLIQDLDSLPDWDMEIFNIDELITVPGCLTFVQLPHFLPTWTGRGCPYRCKFCCNSGLHQMYKGKERFVRKRSVGRLIEEVKNHMARHPSIKAVEFQDETFELSPAWIEEFTERFPREVGVPFAICITGRRLKPKYVAKLKAAGCLMAAVGVETGNEKFRMEVLGKPVSNADLEEAFRACREANIPTVSLNMFGLPFETLRLAMETVALNRRLKPTALWHAVFQPFPGTPFHEVCREEGFLPAESDYLYENLDNAIRQPTMNRQQLEEVDRAFKQLQREIEESLRDEDPLGKAIADFMAQRERYKAEKDEKKA